MWTMADYTADTSGQDGTDLDASRRWSQRWESACSGGAGYMSLTPCTWDTPPGGAWEHVGFRARDTPPNMTAILGEAAGTPRRCQLCPSDCRTPDTLTLPGSVEIPHLMGLEASCFTWSGLCCEHGHGFAEALELCPAS